MSGEGVIPNRPTTLFERMARLSRPDGLKRGRADCEDCITNELGTRCTMNCSPGVSLGRDTP